MGKKKDERAIAREQRKRAAGKRDDVATREEPTVAPTVASGAPVGQVLPPPLFGSVPSLGSSPERLWGRITTDDPTAEEVLDAKAQARRLQERRARARSERREKQLMERTMDQVKEQAKEAGTLSLTDDPVAG